MSEAETGDDLKIYRTANGVLQHHLNNAHGKIKKLKDRLELARTERDLNRTFYKGEIERLQSEIEELKAKLSEYQNGVDIAAAMKSGERHVIEIDEGFLYSSGHPKLLASGQYDGCWETTNGLMWEDDRVTRVFPLPSPPDSDSDTEGE